MAHETQDGQSPFPSYSPDAFAARLAGAHLQSPHAAELHKMDTLLLVTGPVQLALGTARVEIGILDRQTQAKTSDILGAYVDGAKNPIQADQITTDEFMDSMPDEALQLDVKTLSRADYFGINYAMLTEVDEIPQSVFTIADTLVEHAKTLAEGDTHDTRLENILEVIATTALRGLVLPKESGEMAATLVQRSKLHEAHGTLVAALESVGLIKQLEGSLGKVLHMGEKLVGGVPGASFGIDHVQSILHALENGHVATDTYLQEKVGIALGEGPETTLERMYGLAEGAAMLTLDEGATAGLDYAQLSQAIAFRMVLHHAQEVFVGSTNQNFARMRELIGVIGMFDLHQNEETSALWKHKVARRLEPEAVAAPQDGRRDN